MNELILFLVDINSALLVHVCMLYMCVYVPWLCSDIFDLVSWMDLAMFLNLDFSASACADRHVY